jgi:hypothetical protein
LPAAWTVLYELALLTDEQFEAGIKSDQEDCQIRLRGSRRARMRELAIVENYAQLVEALRARAEALDVSNEVLGEVSGLASGYVGKVLGVSGMKPLGRVSLGVLLAALGLKLAVLEDPEAMARMRGRLVKRKPNGLHRRAVNGGPAAAP